MQNKSPMLDGLRKKYVYGNAIFEIPSPWLNSFIKLKIK